MKRIMTVAIFALLTVSACFAQAADEKKPDTVFQKMADYSEGGYKKDVAPIKKVSVFQIMADWINGEPLKWEAKTENKQ